MSAEPTRHRIALELLVPLPEEVDAGAAVTLAIRIACDIDLTGAPYQITSEDGVRARGVLPAFTEERPDSVNIEVIAPEQVGEFTWNFVVPLFIRDDNICEQASLPFSFWTRAHVTGLAVWDCPSPVVIGQSFHLKAGLDCSSGCPSLRGREIEIRDEADAVVGRARLGDTPWPGTNTLYWTELELTAPGRVGLHAWKAIFAGRQLEVPHCDGAFVFSLVADKAPEHTVRVKIVEQETAAPIGDAQVRLGFYRRATDPGGLAQFAVPDGLHELSVWKAGYEAPPQIVEVQGDAELEVEAVLLPVENPDSYWQG
jgi:hypothetical protein